MSLFRDHLLQIDPGAEFSESLPRVTSSSGRVYYAKQSGSSAAETEQYIGEAESLKHIHIAAPGLAPRVLATGPTGDGRRYFLSEYLDLTSLSEPVAQKLAKRLALELHAHKSPQFGFPVPTYCGATRLQNGWFDSWEACYSAQIGDLLSQLSKKGTRYDILCRKGERVRSEVIPKLLGSLSVQPVLLHGDLWSGNVGQTFSGDPKIFDPASYFGHSEADLAIARVFGGFPKTFFDTYHQHLPKTEPVEQYDLRGDLYQLFHYLNHTLLFGDHYAAGAEQKMDILLAANL
ncbi:fructosamine kinase [Mycena amicta]|nr:fructosamine kinase [Mycena amicta]